MLGVVIVHPDQKEVFPLCPEPISKIDGETKNDCEQNAMKRVLKDFKKEHPHLETIFTEDALARISHTFPELEKKEEENRRGG